MGDIRKCDRCAYTENEKRMIEYNLRNKNGFPIGRAILLCDECWGIQLDIDLAKDEFRDPPGSYWEWEKQS